MNLRQMEVFHAIMRSGSVTGAARQLNVSQPAISATLRHCEAQLGMKLFERAGSGLQPTPEAHAIFPTSPRSSAGSRRSAAWRAT